MIDIQLLWWLIVAHFVCDFPLQTEYMSLSKNPNRPDTINDEWFWPMLGHCITHGAGVSLVIAFFCPASKPLAPMLFGLAETAAHFAIDYSKCQKYVGTTIDQAMHVICKLAWAGALLTIAR